MTNDLSVEQKLDLKVGEWVAVRSADEILRTLDLNARFEELPFMPQMLRYCGKKFRVRKRAHKLCDTAFGTGGRELNDSVFLMTFVALVKRTAVANCDAQSFGKKHG